MPATLSRSPTPSTRRLEPSYKPWTPEPYQLRGSEHMQTRGAAVLWLDPGMRKTSIILHAFCELQRRGEARRMIVIAPKRVCELVWRQEAAKWEEFRHLRIVFLHGPKKAKLLAEDADVYLINPEGVVWLAKQFATRPDAWPFDTATFDELTKFKNSQAERSKALRGKAIGGRVMPNLLKRSLRRWGMTGTPNPNGYMDLFGQFLLLDDGAALGRFVTHYRDQYFSVGWNGFDYELQPGAEKRIQARLEPYVFALNADDYLTLPELIDDVIEIELDGEARAAYDAMRKDMVAQLPDGVVEAANTAAAYTKLSQMAGGAVYMPDGSVQEIHTAKLDALSDLIDELQGQQMLIGYEFTHEKDRLKARFGNRMAFLSDARTDKQAQQMQDDWNAGRLQLLACHPASAGHGLNLQEGNARHLCWFGPIWDLELWDQFIRRILRSGNTTARILRHILVVRHSIDELKLQAVAEKDTSQSRLKRALATVLSGEETEFRSQDMVMKLQRAGATAPAENGQQAERRVPAGWGVPKGDPSPTEQSNIAAAPVAEERRAPAGWGKPPGAPQTAEQEQREAIQQKLNPEVEQQVHGETVSADRAFSADVIALKAQVEGGEAPATEEPPFEGATLGTAATPPRPTRSRRTGEVAQPTPHWDVGEIKNAVRDVMNEVNTGIHSQADEEHRNRMNAEHTTRMLTDLMHGAKAAAEAVASLNTVDPSASGTAYELLFGAIEKRLQQLEFADTE